jgi:hypothetical protein
MNQMQDESAADWTQDLNDADLETQDSSQEDWNQEEFSSLTWDEETIRETHREIALRASRASSRRVL